MQCKSKVVVVGLLGIQVNLPHSCTAHKRKFIYQKRTRISFKEVCQIPKFFQLLEGFPSNAVGLSLLQNFQAAAFEIAWKHELRKVWLQLRMRVVDKLFMANQCWQTEIVSVSYIRYLWVSLFLRSSVEFQLT